jgi:hypothetical protein
MGLDADGHKGMALPMDAGNISSKEQTKNKEGNAHGDRQ